MIVLAINVGSSSVRLARYALEGGRPRLLDRTRLETQDPSFLASVLQGPRPEVVVHRVVHGGAELTRPCWVDAAVEETIARLSVLAPLHNPIALAWIRAAARRLPGARQIAVFDTAFFARLPARASTYALPRGISEQLGIRRYGFHGLAHRSMWSSWQARTGRTIGRLVTLQLGAGCSIAAIADGRPLDTSMGMTPLEGLTMATRCGDVDPGVVLHLQRSGGLTAEETATLLEQRSGLLGLSGTSGDLRVLLASTDPAARLAIDVYCQRARKYLGAYLAVLGGADAVAFGGGVGEHLPEIRQRVLADMGWCGLLLDEDANRRAGAGAQRISRGDSAIEAWILPVDEESAMLEEAQGLLGSGGA